MRFFLKTFLLFSAFSVFSQNTDAVLPSIKIDSLYREDQFYFGFTLNTLQNKPAGLSQDKFSTGFSFGFLRDMPLNQKRTLAIAPGIGFAINNFNQNLAVTFNAQTPVYTVLSTDYNKNRFTQYLVEVPLEFRWRSSTFENYKFWRIHGGFKMSYLLYDESLYDNSSTKTRVKNNNDFNKLQYGVYLTSGYNSINVYAYYGLNPLFQSAKTSTETVNMTQLNVGIMFYIL